MDLTKEREGVEHNDGAVYNVATGLRSFRG
jgi:hypothetical protein